MKLTYISIKDISSYEIVVNFPLKNLSNKTWYWIKIHGFCSMKNMLTRMWTFLWKVLINIARLKSPIPTVYHVWLPFLVYFEINMSPGLTVHSLLVLQLYMSFVS